MAAGCYKGWKEEELPGFHEVRALSLHLYKRAGKDGQKIAGHASEEMTRNYQRDHADVVWSEVERTWISAKSLGGFAPVLRQFCACFAQAQKSQLQELAQVSDFTQE